MIACLVDAFKKAFGVDLPTACRNCGRPAPVESVITISDQAQQLIDNVPNGAQLVGQVCVMFCPAPECRQRSAEWTRAQFERLRGKEPF
jgi:hypothetical protein